MDNYITGSIKTKVPKHMHDYNSLIGFFLNFILDFLKQKGNFLKEGEYIGSEWNSFHQETRVYTSHSSARKVQG